MRFICLIALVLSWSYTVKFESISGFILLRVLLSFFILDKKYNALNESIIKNVYITWYKFDRRSMSWLQSCAENMKHVDDKDEAVMMNNNGSFFSACNRSVRKELCLRQHHRDMDKYVFIFVMVTFYIVLLGKSCFGEIVINDRK